MENDEIIVLFINKSITSLIIMTRCKRENLKARILKLAALKSTGTPCELAIRLEISERTVKRIIREIREDGYEIEYCHIRRTYVTGENYQ